MAEKHGKGSKVFLGAYDFSGQGRSLDLDVVDSEIVDASTFSEGASGARVKVAGRVAGAIAHKGVLTNATSGWDNYIHGKLGSMSGQPITIIPGQAAEGDVAFNAEIVTGRLNIPVKVDDIVAIEADYKTQGQLGQGVAVGYQITTARGTYVGSGYQVTGVGKHDQWLVAMHVIEVNNAGSIALKLQECATDTSGSYADVSGSTFTVTGLNSKIVRFPGSRDAYVRTVSTPDTSETCKYVVAISKIPKGG